MSQNFYEHIKDEYLEELYDRDPEDPVYSIKKSELYMDIRNSANVRNNEAVQVSRLLDKGEVEEADEKIKELLVND